MELIERLRAHDLDFSPDWLDNTAQHQWADAADDLLLEAADALAAERKRADEAEAERADQWRKRRGAESSLDVAKAAATALQEQVEALTKALEEAETKKIEAALIDGGEISRLRSVISKARKDLDLAECGEGFSFNLRFIAKDLARALFNPAEADR